MIIPTFKERQIPIYEMDFYINEDPTEEEKQFKRILESIKEFHLIPNVEEMTAILEYESQALDYVYKLAFNTLHKHGFKKDLLDINNAVNDPELYKIALKHDTLFIKYCTLKKVLGELFVIHYIKDAVSEVIFNCSNEERKLLEIITNLKTESE